jgi:hypothetical protein
MNRVQASQLVRKRGTTVSCNHSYNNRCFEGGLVKILYRTVSYKAIHVLHQVVGTRINGFRTNIRKYLRQLRVQSRRVLFYSPACHCRRNARHVGCRWAVYCPVELTFRHCELEDTTSNSQFVRTEGRLHVFRKPRNTAKRRSYFMYN